ncbi:MAG: hypothetical protein MK105_12415 [Crocinitomicaceae bacterium]|nr:hypothetical protein [Crocinitomicaceae bacterium]
MHDPRIARFFTIDPLTSKYPHYTPYSFSGNKVIHAIELEGAEELEVNPSPEEVAGFEVEVEGVSQNDWIYSSAYYNYQKLYNSNPTVSPADMADYTITYFSNGVLTSKLSPEALAILGDIPQWQINSLSNISATVSMLSDMGEEGEGQAYHDYIMSRDMNGIGGNAGIYNEFAINANRANALAMGTVGGAALMIMGSASFGGSLPKPTFRNTNFSLAYEVTAQTPVVGLKYSSSGIGVSEVRLKVISDNEVWGSIHYANGEVVDIAGNINAKGQTLELTNIAYYGANKEVANVMSSGTRATFNAARSYAKTLGYNYVRISYLRGAGSTAAKPHSFDRIFSVE